MRAVFNSRHCQRSDKTHARDARTAEAFLLLMARERGNYFHPPQTEKNELGAVGISPTGEILLFLVELSRTHERSDFVEREESEKEQGVFERLLQTFEQSMKGLFLQADLSDQKDEKGTMHTRDAPQALNKKRKFFESSRAKDLKADEN